MKEASESSLPDGCVPWFFALVTTIALVLVGVVVWITIRITLKYT